MYFAYKSNKIEVLDFVCLHFVRISVLSAFLRTIFSFVLIDGTLKNINRTLAH